MGVVLGVEGKGGFIPTGCLAVSLSQILGPSISFFSILGLTVLGQQGLGQSKSSKFLEDMMALWEQCLQSVFNTRCSETG